MPWSEWIQPADGAATPFRRMIAYDASGNAEIVDFGVDAAFFIGFVVPWNAVQFRAAMPNMIGPLPYPLFILEEGVDYAAIPGSDPADPYRFVEYDGTGEWLSWTWDNGLPEIESVYLAPGSGTVSIVSPTDFDDVDTAPFIPGLQGGGIFSKPTGGTVFDTFTGAEPPGTILADPGDPGPVEAFTIVAELDVEGGGDDRVYFTFPDPVAHYRPPRYRYWIPNLAPLRLIQRGDGLGMGSGRLFGSGTRQSSTRVLGAL